MSERAGGTGGTNPIESRWRAVSLLRPRRGVLGLSTGLAALTALLVVLAPASATGAASPHALKTFVAPYSGAASNSGVFSMSGCGTGNAVPAFPSFDPTTGKGSQSGSIAVKGCATSNSTGITDLELGEMGAAAFTTTTGMHTVKVYWTITFTITLKVATGGTTPFASASTLMIGEADLNDNTNGTSIASSFTWFQSNGTAITGTVTWHHSVMLVFPITGKLASGHKYSVESLIFEYCGASADAGANSASASVNMATTGDGAKLTKITLL